MSLTINVGLTTNDGGIVNTGSFVQFDVYFPTQGGGYSTNISIWRDETSKDNGLKKIKPVEIPNLFFNKDLEPIEFIELTPITIHEDVKEYLEGFLGEGTISINS